MPNDIAPSAPASSGGAPSKLAAEIRRRRTFAIISHPDAGKTTLTEKLLLFGGAIQLAGQVKAKRDGRNTRSDWMAIEKARGISVVTSVMTFEYEGRRLQPARYAGPRGLLRPHLPHAHRRRLGHHGHRRRQGHRGAHAQAVRSVPPARHPDHHLHQQARPRGARAARAARRDREGAGARYRADGVADRQGARLPRHLRSRQAAHPPHRRGARGLAGLGAGRPRFRDAARARRAGATGARRSRSCATRAGASISRPSARARCRRSTSAARCGTSACAICSTR